jgi:hypothetical protein
MNILTEIVQQNCGGDNIKTLQGSAGLYAINAANRPLGMNDLHVDAFYVYRGNLILCHS